MLVIYDLDGTLIDSEIDLISSVQTTLKEFGQAPLADSLIKSYIGNGAPVLMRRTFGEQADDALVSQALTFFLNHYREHCMDQTYLYEGIVPLLERCASAGWYQAVLTNKPVKISEHILSGLGVAKFFQRVYGGNSFEHKKPHPIGIQTLLQEFGTSPKSAVMVGDSCVDIETAHNAGIASIGVLYGIKPETVIAAKPSVLVERADQIFPEIEKLFLAEVQNGIAEFSRSGIL
jgi:phosphoglycolate phosphatase